MPIRTCQTGASATTRTIRAPAATTAAVVFASGPAGAKGLHERIDGEPQRCRRAGSDDEQRAEQGGCAHRWVALTTGDDVGGVLGAAVKGEDHAVSEYEKADLGAGFREVVARQHAAVVAGRDEVKALHVAD